MTENFTNITTELQEARNYELFLALGVFEIMIGFVGSAGNLLTCFAVVRNKHLHHATNFYVLSLSVADFLVTCILVPVRAAEHLAIYNNSEPPTKRVIVVAVFIGRATILSSLASLSALSMDRYSALKYPIVYRLEIRYNYMRTFIIVAILWILSLFLTTIPMFPGVTPIQGLIIFVVFVVIMTLIIFITSWKVLKLVKQLFNRLQKFRSTKTTVAESSNGDHFSFSKRSVFRAINKIDRPADVAIDERSNCFEHRPFFSFCGRGDLAFDNNAFSIDHQPVTLLCVKHSNSENESFNVYQFENKSASISDKKTRSVDSKASTLPTTIQKSRQKSRKKPILPANTRRRLGGVTSLADGYIAKTIAIVTCVFVVCVYPRIILILYHTTEKENEETRIWRLWLKVLIYINSVINPFLYAWRFRDFRREFIYLIRKLKQTIF